MDQSGSEVNVLTFGFIVPQTTSGIQHGNGFFISMELFQELGGFVWGEGCFCRWCGLLFGVELGIFANGDLELIFRKSQQSPKIGQFNVDDSFADAVILPFLFVEVIVGLPQQTEVFVADSGDNTRQGCFAVLD